MKKGFTLLELIIVVVIIAILAVIAIPIYTINLDKARKSQALATMAAIREAEIAYSVVNAGAYTAGPTVSADLDGITGDEITLTIASTTDYAYSVDTALKCVIANHTTAANDFCMCIKSGALTTGATVCAPACP